MSFPWPSRFIVIAGILLTVAMMILSEDASVWRTELTFPKSMFLVNLLSCSTVTNPPSVCSPSFNGRSPL